MPIPNTEMIQDRSVIDQRFTHGQNMKGKRKKKEIQNLLQPIKPKRSPQMDKQLLVYAGL